MTLDYKSKSPDDTFSLGKRIGQNLVGGEIILLTGDLGAGKTLFTKGLAQGIGIDDQTKVLSPSFTLVNIYRAKLDIIHIDLYRLENDEIFELGLEDYMDRDHIMVVEWAQKATDFFKGDLIEVNIEYLDESSRKISIFSELPWIDMII